MLMDARGNLQFRIVINNAASRTLAEGVNCAWAVIRNHWVANDMTASWKFTSACGR